jgi:hypothetical protein
MRRCTHCLWPLLVACAGDGAPDHPALTTDAAEEEVRSAAYAEVTAIFARSCAYQRCHDAPVFGGGLSFAPGADFHRALVGVPACEYERMARVEPGHPERSWLMTKLTAPARPLGDPYATYIEFEPAADWDPGRRACRDQTDDGVPLFGQRMPATAPNMLSSAEIEIIRAWIADGAPR